MEKRKEHECEADGGRSGDNLWRQRRQSSQAQEIVSAWPAVSSGANADRTTKEGKAFKAQSVKITNIAPLWGHEETEPDTF